MEINETFLAFADIMPIDLVEVEEGVERQAPSEILVLPFGTIKYTQDGEDGEFLFDEADADNIIGDFEKRKKDLLIDYEHANLIKGGEAPAGGWGECLIKTKDGLVARVKNWTNKARKYLENGEYRYHSPVIQFSKETERPIVLQSLGMTNHPAIHGSVALVPATDIMPIDDKSSDETVHEYENIVSNIKKSIDEMSDQSNLKQIALSDNVELQELKDDLEKELSSYSKFSKEKGGRIEKSFHKFTDNLFLSDLTKKEHELKKDNLKQKDAIMEKELTELLGLNDTGEKDAKVDADGKPIVALADAETMPEIDILDDELDLELDVELPEGEQDVGADNICEKIVNAVAASVEANEQSELFLTTIADILGVEANEAAIMDGLRSVTVEKETVIAATDAKISVSKALEDGKISESMVKWAEGFAIRDSNAWKAYTDGALPNVVPSNKEVKSAKAPATKKDKVKGFTDGQIAVAKGFGITKETYGEKAYVKEMTELFSDEQNKEGDK